MIVQKGFRIDEYLVKTEDDYTVAMWRVVNLEKPITRAHPVFLQHGLLDCSISWFLHSDKYFLIVIQKSFTTIYPIEDGL